MAERGLTRREMLLRTGLTVGMGMAAGMASPAPRAEERRKKVEPFRYGLNTSTIRGQKLSLPEEIEVAAKAGYHAIEPWIGEIDEYVRGGGSLRELGQRLRDNGLTVEGAIGFFEWIVDDAGRRARALEEAKRNMELLQQIGGLRIAAPPLGATDISDFPLLKAAERYRALLELGERMGVVPMVEMWGFSKTLTRLGEAALVAIESGHPQACVLADAYHMHKGGSAPHGLRRLNGAYMHIFHMNDYPADPPRETIQDADRVYPGDGVAPLHDILRDLYDIGFRGALSLELFNPNYYRQDALTVARTGLEKMRAAVQKAL